MSKFLLLAPVVLLINLPFGYWRAKTRRFSTAWFLAVHAPVPLIVVLRLAAGVSWRPATFGVLVTAYAAGQYLGGHWRRRITSG